MADPITGATSSAEQMRANYEMYKNLFEDSDKSLVNQQTFLNLLVAEMANQDPLEPTSNTEFISQLATFSQMQYMQQSSVYSMATYASSLVGKIATGTKMDGKDLIMTTGVVSKVTKSGDSYWVTIDGIDFDITKITSVADNTAGNSAGMQSNSLGDSISRAAMMIGMYATVGKNVEGFIDAISVKDGKIQVLINGKNYAIEDITEVCYATVIYPDDNEGVEGEDGESVDGVDGSEGDKTPDVDDGEDTGDSTVTDEDTTDIPDLDEEGTV